MAMILVLLLAERLNRNIGFHLPDVCVGARPASIASYLGHVLIGSNKALRSRPE
jgi:hypothetical protein